MIFVDRFVQLLVKMVISFFHLFHISLDEQKEKNINQFIRFCLVGVTNTLLSYIINLVILLALKPLLWKHDYYLANIIAFILSVAWSFYWNNKYVFGSKDGKNQSKKSLLKMLIKTYVAYSFTGVFLANLLSWIWIDCLGISKYIAPLLNLVVSVPINFILNKFWAFKKD